MAFQLVEKPKMRGDIDNLKKGERGDNRLDSVLMRYNTVFQEALAFPFYQLSPAELVGAKEYVIGLLRNGNIRRSNSPFSASIFSVKEKDILRGVVDYRALNRITKRNNAPISCLDEIFDRFGRSRVFSKLDLKTVFHQIRFRPQDIEKTAFNINYGKSEYNVMPMGLCNAPVPFQSVMNRLFYDCIEYFYGCVHG